MLTIKLGSPKPGTIMVGDIPTGTVFFGTAYKINEVKLNLKLAGNHIVNLETFQPWSGQKQDSLIYNYEEITDAIITRTSYYSSINHIHPNSNDNSIGGNETDKLDSNKASE